MHRVNFRVLTLLPLCFLVLAAALRADDDLDSQEQKALATAAQRVAPSIVRIETVGGLERVDKVLFGTGPTTGLVVDADGYIISSEFNFINEPSSILVRLPDGTRKPAKLVATDHGRKLVLLKIAPDHPLPVPEAAPVAEMRVGQWCVAMGRTFEDDRPNMAVGLVSALNRIWGKAIQTDAAVSPNNYGGPLVDIRGRVLGVLVPLSPMSADDVAGFEWYDSGIGFAVPLETLQHALPRLRKSEDLYSGVAGVHMKSKNPYTGDSELAGCRPNSPADKAGFKAGDRLVEIDGRKVNRAADVRQEISRHDAGDKIRIVALRGKERIERDLVLVAKLDPFQHGFLGVLPLRSSDSPGVKVRYVYPKSPAAEAKIEPGDTIISVAGKEINSRDELLHATAALEPDMDAELAVRHGGAVRTMKVKFTTLPDALPPASLPPAHAAAKAPPENRPKVGKIDLTVPEFKNKAWAYVPENYDPAGSYGMIVWLHGATVPEASEVLTRWKSLCDANDLVFVAPLAAEQGTWQADEVEYVEKVVRQVQQRYAIDPARVVLYGRENGGTLAYMTAFHNRELFRGIIAMDAVAMIQPQETEPGHRLAVYAITAKNSRQGPMVAGILQMLRQMKIPVTQKDLGAEMRNLSNAEVLELIRWVDMLDRV